jgi:hypothetical protein
MKPLSYLLLLVVLLTGPASVRSGAQAPAEWHDDLVDHLIGTWNLGGQIMGREAHHQVEVGWVLNHQFLRIHERTEAGAPESEKRYEAIWFLVYCTPLI